jgi:predicted NAD/FAD-binding protein
VVRFSLPTGEEVKKKVAIVGTGMAGMSAAYFLKDHFDLTIFEKNDYIGGHTNTVYIQEENEEKPIDSGFIVFNEVTYPLMLKLFKELQVPYYDSDMSFSVLETKSGLEYNGSSLWNGLFAQKRNLFKPSFWKMILDIQKLCKMAPKIISESKYETMTVRDFVKKEGYGQEFLDHFVVPMSSAVWSTPQDKMLDFPMKMLVRFFLNHGFLGLDTQHQWKTVEKGSQTYKLKIIETFKDKIQINNGVKSVEVKDDNVILKTEKGETHTFDHVIFSSHADETLQMIKNPTERQKELLSPFKYQENIAILHTDETVMPKIKKNWSSWNFVYKKNDAFTVYYMNRLQKISKKKNYFININGEEFVDKNKIIKRIVYHHPVFDSNTYKAQETLSELNKNNPKLYFCGAYFRYGFHEDALFSSVNLCEEILGKKVFQ